MSVHQYTLIYPNDKSQFSISNQIIIFLHNMNMENMNSQKINNAVSSKVCVNIPLTKISFNKLKVIAKGLYWYLNSP